MRATRNLRRAREPRAGDVVATRLRHVLVVGGSAGEWAATGSARWAELMGDLARQVGDAGGEWLTIRPYGGDTVTAGPTGTHEIDGCSVVVDGCADGRDRLLAAIDRLRSRAGTEITEDALGAELLAPAAAEPDLALVLGPSDRLPPSLVWELAYSELVFTDCAWSDLGEKHLHDAIVEFNRRERRFGGLPS